MMMMMMMTDWPDDDDDDKCYNINYPIDPQPSLLVLNQVE